MAYKFKDDGRIGDSVVYCAICTNKLWGSDSKKLIPETGRGGLIVCPDCDDSVDYGIVPYKIHAERPVPFTNYLLTSAPSIYSTSQYPPFNYEEFDPLSTTPIELLGSGLTWDKENIYDWELWSLNTWDKT